MSYRLSCSTNDIRNWYHRFLRIWFKFIYKANAGDDLNHASSLKFNIPGTVWLLPQNKYRVEILRKRKKFFGR